MVSLYHILADLVLSLYFVCSDATTRARSCAKFARERISKMKNIIYGANGVIRQKSKNIM